MVDRDDGRRNGTGGGAPAPRLDLPVLRAPPRGEAVGGAHAGMEDPGGADGTLGGYFAVHGRPPAFEGSDGEPYTVAVDVEETDDPDRPYVAFFLFLRWARTGAGIMGHLESGDIAVGATEGEARERALALSLFEVRAELDRAIARRRHDLADGG